MRILCKQIKAGHRHIDVEMYFPPNEEHFPNKQWSGVLLLHELFGLTSNVRADARHLARSGYLVFAPDLYTGSMSKYCIKMLFTRDALLNKSSSPPVQEIHDCLDALRDHPKCNGKLGMIGMCLSGGFVLQMACREDMLAPVVYHHGAGLLNGGLPKEEHQNVKHTIQGHFAEKDLICRKFKVDALKRSLGNKLEENFYPRIGHGI